MPSKPIHEHERVVGRQPTHREWTHDVIRIGHALSREVHRRRDVLEDGRELGRALLRDDLGFFEKLIPTSAGGVAIRSLQAEVLGGTQLKWQVLVMQPVKNAPEFYGKLEMSVSGTLAGKPWMLELPNGGAQSLQFRQYRRIEGMVDLPPNAVVKNVSAKLMEGAATRAVQSIKL